MKVVFLSLILAFSVFSPPVLSNPQIYELGITEFILKNASPLIKQINLEKGLGYESLKNQLLLSDCSTKFLDEAMISEDIKPYVFHANFMASIADCSLDLKYENLSSILKGKKAYLLISGESLKSPMSYFGHSSILFLDDENFYFSPVVSVLAPTENLTLFEQFGKGAFGKIRAVVKVLPLHKVIDAYNNKESRNLEFIYLPEENFRYEKIIEYFENKSNSNMDYNFFMENCSTYIYEALNFSCECMEDIPSVATPLSLERHIKELGYDQSFGLNSLYYEFNKSYAELKNREKSSVKEMVVNLDAEYPIDAQKLGDVSVKASRLSFESYGRPFPSYENILKVYGKNDSVLQEVPFLKDLSQTDNLYISTVKLGFYDGLSRVKLSAIDYSNFEQRNKSYLFSKMNIGSAEWLLHDDEIEFNKLDLIDIEAITPINFVTRTPSWFFRIGADRIDGELQSSVRFGLGGAFSYNSLTFYSMPAIEWRNGFETSIYSGLILKNDILSTKYEYRSNNDSVLTFFKRNNERYGYSLNFKKNHGDEVTSEISFSIYF